MTDDADLTLHESGLGYQRAAVTNDERYLRPVGPEAAVLLERQMSIMRNPHRWHPSAADHHDRGESCGEDDCGWCIP